MMETGRRGFFKSVLVAGAALAASGMGASLPRKAEASLQEQIKGVCLFVPSLGKAGEFVEMMNNNAPGDWTVHALTGSLIDRYFKTKSLYEEAKVQANTFVGAVDPGSFAVVQAAIVDSGGSFHYITYEDRNRITFSARL